MTIVLITGPSRSGKSEWAETLAAQITADNSQPVIYIATAKTNPLDAEWQARIEQHRQRRPETWLCEEVPVDLAGAILQTRAEVPCLLVDSLGTWLANLIEQDDDTWTKTQQRLISALVSTTAHVVLVAEETGWGVVPAYELGRRFRDRLGSLSRSIGEISTDTYLVTSGYALNLSQLGTSVKKQLNGSPSN